jgi:hypothetical protein
MKPLTYITTPYTPTVAPGCGSPTLETARRVKQMRFEEVTKATAWLMEQFGWNVFSPITHSHPLHIISDLRGDWQFWKKVDTEYLQCSERLINFVIPGWRHSIGVTEENKIARELGVPIFYLHYVSPGKYRLSDFPETETEPNLFDYDGEYTDCTR